MLGQSYCRSGDYPRWRADDRVGERIALASEVGAYNW
jgi:hypothetical protein